MSTKCPPPDPLTFVTETFTNASNIIQMRITDPMSQYSVDGQGCKYFQLRDRLIEKLLKKLR